MFRWICRDIQRDSLIVLLESINFRWILKDCERSVCSQNSILWMKALMRGRYLKIESSLYVEVCGFLLFILKRVNLKAQCGMFFWVCTLSHSGREVTVLIIVWIDCFWLLCAEVIDGTWCNVVDLANGEIFEGTYSFSTAEHNYRWIDLMCALVRLVRWMDQYVQVSPSALSSIPTLCRRSSGPPLHPPAPAPPPSLFPPPPLLPSPFSSRLLLNLFYSVFIFADGCLLHIQYLLITYLFSLHWTGSFIVFALFQYWNNSVKGTSVLLIVVRRIS